MENDEQNTVPANTVYKEIRLKIPGYHNIADERTLKLIQELLEKSVKIEKIQVEHTKPGYRFVPKDEELILDYLKKKITNDPLMNDEIQEVNLYQHDPQYFSERYDSFEDEWYFFTPRDRKYLRGSRPNRAAGTGYWKATGADKKIHYNGEIVGFRKVLVFYEGKPPKGDKTCWIMHEYRVNQPARVRQSSNDMRLDDYVLCRIYKKANKTSKNQQPEVEKSIAQPVHEFPETSQEIDVLLGNNTIDCDEMMNHEGGIFNIGVEHPNELINMVGDHGMTHLQNVLIPQVSPSMEVKHDLRFHGDGGYIHMPMEGTSENMHLNQGTMNLKAKEDVYLNSIKLSTPPQFELVDSYSFSNPYSPDILSFLTDL